LPAAGDGDVADGDVPSSVLAAQIQAMNEAYAPAGISFVVAGVDKFTNASVRTLRSSVHSVLLLWRSGQEEVRWSAESPEK
jgi:hypothetical protein